MINSIDIGHNISHNPTEINNAFKEFYEALYTSQVNENLNQM